MSLPEKDRLPAAPAGLTLCRRRELLMSLGLDALGTLALCAATDPFAYSDPGVFMCFGVGDALLLFAAAILVLLWGCCVLFSVRVG